MLGLRLRPSRLPAIASAYTDISVQKKWQAPYSPAARWYMSLIRIGSAYALNSSAFSAGVSAGGGFILIRLSKYRTGWDSGQVGAVKMEERALLPVIAASALRLRQVALPESRRFFILALSR